MDNRYWTWHEEEQRFVPNPGSEMAIELGCICPVLDNLYGLGVGIYRGTGTKEKLFWYTEGCLVHKEKPGN